MLGTVATCSEVELPVTVAGTNVAVLPAGAPLTWNEIALEKPFTRLIAIVNAPVVPCGALTLSLVTESENVGAVTTKVSVVVCVSVPLVPVTVTDVVLEDAVDAAVKVSVRDVAVLGLAGV